MAPLDYAAAGLGLAIIWAYLTSRKSTSHYLPPGPKGYPLIGNMLEMPQTNEWEKYAEWAQQYGPLFSVSILGRRIVIISSSKVMSEFDKRGAIYSQRPVLEMGGVLVGYDQTLVLIEYGNRFRTYRKHFSRYIGAPKPIQEIHPLIEVESRRFLKRMLKGPEELMTNLRKLTGGIILKLTYGYEVVDGEDPFINLIEHANGNFNAATVPGAFPVDFFPALKSLPSWFPTSGFMKTAADWAKDTAAMVEVPWQWTKKQMAAGTAAPSFASTGLEEEKSMSEADIRDLKLTAASMYGGGADTTVSAEYAFFLAMLLRPDVQKKAQEELDSVIGTDRLPNLADRPHLPYVNAIVTEVLRWNSVAPTGVPHVAIEDGYINGYFIPKGTLILANLWHMLHDPAVYPDPFTFDPARHLAPEAPGAAPEFSSTVTPEHPAPQTDPRGVCFGYGRRICPGMHLAEASLFSCVSRSLAVFDVQKALGADGSPITPKLENTSGIISYPKEFPYTLKPRSEKAVALISEEIPV